jgi:hypothetical protein
MWHLGPEVKIDDFRKESTLNLNPAIRVQKEKLFV